MKLAYRAIDQAGNEVADRLEAASVEEANVKLRECGLYVTSLGEDTVSVAPAAQRARAPGRRGRRHKQLALFSRQLSVLVRTGTPLADALSAVGRQLAPGPWRTVVADLHRQVEEGVTLSEAMELHDAYFDSVSRSLVQAGESSGRLDEMLDRMAHLTRQQLKIRRSVTGALVYPFLLAVVGITVVGVMLGFVVPRFTGLFETLDAPLPPSTQAMMAASDLLRSKWWVFATVIPGGVVAAVAAILTPAGKRVTDAVVVRLPYLGQLIRDLLTARFARILGVLLESQVPLLDALRLTRQSTGNSLYADMIGEAEDSVVRGEPLSAVLAQSPLVNPYVAEAVRHGEQSGQVSPVLLDMAEFMDEENEALVRTWARLIEPIMLIVLGLVVAVVAVSLFLPLFDLTALTQGG